MLKKMLSSNKGEGYIDICISVVVFVMILVIAINLFSFITLKVEMSQIADDLIKAATYAGEFGEDFENADLYNKDEFFYYDIETGADEYYNSALKRVQLGARMWVTISKETYIKGLGIFQIPITVSVTRSGLSERYWK